MRGNFFFAIYLPDGRRADDGFAGSKAAWRWIPAEVGRRRWRNEISETYAARKIAEK